MKGQAPLNLRTRKSAKERASNGINTKNAKLVDTETSAKAFIAGGEIPWKMSKVEKTVVTAKTKNTNTAKAQNRYNTRSASSNQSKLTFTAIDKEPKKPTTKRKSNTTVEAAVKNTKKLKVEKKKILNSEKKDENDELVKEAEPTILEQVITKRVKTTLKEIVTEKIVEKLDIEAPVEAIIEKPKKAVVPKKIAVDTLKETMHEDKQVEPIEITKAVEKVVPFEAEITTTKDIKVTEITEKVVEEEKKLVYTPINEEIVDSPSPPSFLTEPATPPTHMSTPPVSAPYKTYLTHTDKERIEREITTLTKLRKALDIVITDRLARNRPSLYHQIEPVLRNSTGRAVTISHVCKIMYITPKLYTLEAKELRNYGGSVTEALLIQFGKDWSVPLAGKDLQMRSDMLQSALTDFFATHKEPDATVPQIELPRLAMVVDKKEWMKKANLPPGVKSLLQAHEKAKAAAIDSEKPKPKPIGSVKDRMAALKARLAEKKGSSS